MSGRLSGQVLLQVEGSGEAWYVNPGDLKRYYIGSPAQVFKIMGRLSLGVNNNSFSNIANNRDLQMSKRLKGRILLKVEDGGKAYYVSPDGTGLIYLGRPNDAFTIMIEQGLGITNDNLNKIQIGTMK